MSIRGLLVDPIPNSPNERHMNCIADSKENYQEIVGVRRVECFTLRWESQLLPHMTIHFMIC